ncbi:uncharacterized protein VTP21DRAFT_8816 [Calcarisporiella thermophila]|uniref:uncharacterized protein n=1 Tax=Calcarisporiella thermophila TaxID=911321 RepID=UPI0037445DEC
MTGSPSSIYIYKLGAISDFSTHSSLNSKALMTEKKKVDPAVHLFAGATSGLAACVILQPLDLLKTRLQQQRQQHLAFLREAAANGTKGITPYNSTLYTTVQSIIKNESALGLWRGTIPTIVRNVPGSSLYFFTLNEIRQFFLQHRPSGTLSNRENLVAGATARALVGFLLMPITIVKVRYESNFYNYRNIYDALTSIVRQEGIKGLFAGYGATAMRDAPFAGIYVLFYEAMKRHLSSYASTRSIDVAPAAVHMSSGVIAGISATLITHPFDMLKTRMQLRPQVYTNTWKSAAKVYREEGFIGFFDGLSMRLLRKTLNSSIAWTVYEEIVRWHKREQLLGEKL